MKRARDVRDQLQGLMERVEIELSSNPLDNMAIRKVRQLLNVLVVHGMKIYTRSQASPSLFHE